jgi:hypothetical protein
VKISLQGKGVVRDNRCGEGGTAWGEAQRECAQPNRDMQIRDATQNIQRPSVTRA